MTIDIAGNAGFTAAAGVEAPTSAAGVLAPSVLLASGADAPDSVGTEVSEAVPLPCGNVDVGADVDVDEPSDVPPPHALRESNTTKRAHARLKASRVEIAPLLRWARDMLFLRCYAALSLRDNSVNIRLQSDVHKNIAFFLHRGVLFTDRLRAASVRG
ncbi:hypothetical protein [Caballeronia sp. INDeC2]|uniref:hypothetical protein n=1 Tax=Caballeronia sp. INDeC2 TaxID=2921747 RepID=UPI0020293624|nr:hypothetical protein [Caballeronia sp. INDeC2]